MTGGKGAGKTTLLEALLDGAPVPGVRSEVERGTDGLPLCVVLAQRGTDRRCIVGRRETGPMTPDKDAFDGPASDMLRVVRRAPGAWAAVDEIGFLEECSEAYRSELRQLLEEKRVLAAISKADTPFLCELRARDDCFVLDLDEVEEEA